MLGRTLVGATPVKGPESAYKTARLLYGKDFSKDVLMDLGIMDIKIEPLSTGKGARISFTPDPHLTTSGGINLTKRVAVSDKGKVFPLARSEIKIIDRETH